MYPFHVYLLKAKNKCKSQKSKQIITRISGVITTVRYINVESLYCTPETNITRIRLYTNYAFNFYNEKMM